MKCIIIGAFAGGTTAAARLRRLNEQANIIIFERGEFITLPNGKAVTHINKSLQEKSVSKAKEASLFAQLYNVDTRLQTEIIAIDTTAKKVTAYHHPSNRIYEESYDTLILSLGTKSVIPDLPGVDLPGIFTVKNAHDIQSIRKDLRNHRVHKATIIGAGFVALEMAEILNNRGIQVTVIESCNQILPSLDYPIAAVAQQHIRAKGVHLQLASNVTGFTKVDEQITVHTDNGDVEADMVILSIGIVPDTQLAQRAGLMIGDTNGIVVNEFLQSSNEAIYAVGPAIEFANPISGQPSYSNFEAISGKQGRICANNIVLGNLETYKGAINVSIVKIFDLTVAAAGLPTHDLSAAGIAFTTSTTHSFKQINGHAEEVPFTIQLAFATASGQLLNAQIAGYSGVEKRIEMLAAEIQQKGNIYQLTEWEHNLTTPYAVEKDPINTAGFVAKNILNKLLQVFYVTDISSLTSSNILIDLRSAQQFQEGTIGNATNIPLENMRQFVDILPKNQRVFLFCETGKKAYLAQRILVQNGFAQVFVLSGGLCSWHFFNNEKIALANSLANEVV